MAKVEVSEQSNYMFIFSSWQQLMKPISSISNCVVILVIVTRRVFCVCLIYLLFQNQVVSAFPLCLYPVLDGQGILLH